MPDSISNESLSSKELLKEPSSNAKKGLWIKTYGCQMNEYDSEKVLALLSKDYKLVDTPEQAEICLLYTSPSPRDATLSRMPSSA